MVQSRIKALEKMEIVKPEADEKKIYFRFPPSPPASHKVVEIEGLRKAYGDLEVFNGLDLRIEKGDRIAVVGVNGAGKSTLARILAGVEPYQEGTRDVGVNTVIGYFAQHQAEELNPDNEVLAEVEEELLPNRLCSYLFELSQVFNRFYDQVPVLKAEGKSLSSRLALCRLTADTLKSGLGLLGIATLERM